jgi:hypothetical protein
MVTLTATQLAELPLQERIAHRAAAVDWRNVLLTLLLVVPYVVGWTARMVVRAVGWLLAFAWAAVVEGYQAGAGKPKDG